MSNLTSNLVLYGYGIVDNNGNPWWDESCVCKDRAPMEQEVEQLNDDTGDPRYPYRVVPLYYSEIG